MRPQYRNSAWIVASIALVLLVSPPASTGSAGGASVARAELAVPEGGATPASAYAVTFDETGLPGGTLWEVGLEAAGTAFFTTSNSTGSTLVRHLGNGSYEFFANASGAFAPAPSNFTFTVKGSALSVPVLFATGALLTLAETGLTPGTEWSVNVNNGTHVTEFSSIGPELRAVEPPGNYTVSPFTAGHNASPANVSITLPLGGAGIVYVTFGPILIGYLSGVITDDAATVWLDGSQMGFNAGGGFTWALEPGFYTMIVAGNGVDTFSALEQVRAGRTTLVYVELTAMTTVPPLPPAPFTRTDAVVMYGLAGMVIALAATLFWRERKHRRRLPDPSSPRPPDDAPPS